VSDDTQRAAFEAWAEIQGYDTKRRDMDDGYALLVTDYSWDAWKAAVQYLRDWSKKQPRER
jgi:hypothetical protein